MIRLLLISLFIFTSTSAFAWGKRGHSIVCQTAAALLHNRSQMMKVHSFDLGYYCNVPDLVWKKPATYSVEAPQHFMDLEIFSREFAKLNFTGDPFAQSRAEFDRAFPQIPLSAGRSYWRVRELMDSLHETASSLGTKSNPDLQEKWLVTAGAIGHYIGDLAQPLHVTEDYDGQQEPGQKGIHHWFEEVLVDELSSTQHPGKLEADVGDLAVKQWKKVASSQRSVLEILKDETSESFKRKAELMKLDKKMGRKDAAKAAEAFAPMIRERLAAGAVALATLWTRELNWTYHGEKFYNFAASPEYIAPPVTASSAPKADPTPAP